MFFCIAVLLGAFSCHQGEKIENDYSKVILTAGIEDELTKIVLQNEGHNIWFSPGDSIIVYQRDKAMYTYNIGLFRSTLTMPSATSEFEMVKIGDITFDGTTINAIYPPQNKYLKFWASYEERTKTDFIVDVNSKQEAIEGSIGNSFCMVAKSNSRHLSFKNVLGGIKFSVSTDSITHAVFYGNNSGNYSEYIAGTMAIDIDEDGNFSTRMIGNHSPIITVTAPNGGTFKKGVWYYFAAIPIELKNGYTLRFYKGNVNDYSALSGTYVCTSPVTIKRSVWGRVGEADESVSYYREAQSKYVAYKTIDGKPSELWGCSSGNPYNWKQLQDEVKCSYDDKTGYYSIYNEDCYITQSHETFYYYKFSNQPSPNTTIKEILIGDRAFLDPNNGCSYCTSLESVIFANGVESTGKFAHCTSLSEIILPTSISVFSRESFRGCSSLTHIAIPTRSTPSFGNDAFLECENLKRVDIDDLSRWLIWWGCWFDNRYSNPLSNGADLYVNGDIIKELIIPEDVDAIKAYAFYGCRSLERVIINHKIKTIGTEAFYMCDNIKSIVFNVTTPPTLASNCFPNDCTIYVPEESLDAFRKANGWSSYKNRIQPI